jgi:hypothetical protein
MDAATSRGFINELLLGSVTFEASNMAPMLDARVRNPRQVRYIEPMHGVGRREDADS